MRFIAPILLFASALSASVGALGPAGRTIVLDGAQIIDGSGGAPVSSGRIVIKDDRIVGIGPVDRTPAPPDAERLDLSGRTIIPGLIDLHFHIEDDPRLALRQLSHGVTTFRDPGQWN